MKQSLVLTLLFILASCSSESGNNDSTVDSTPVRINITVPDAAGNGVFDAAPVSDGSSTMWMSFSVVDASINDPVLPHISSRIASSTDGGLTWTVDSTKPNSPVDIQVPYGNGTTWATWHYEVSRLAFDPGATNINERWKLFWHRYLEANISGGGVRLFEHGWIGMSTAPAPTGPWSAERKLFVGGSYDAGNDVTIGPPEFDLEALFSGNLSACAAFTEPGVIAVNSDLYISLKCATGDTGGKIVLLKCANDFTSGGCSYLGDLITDSEAGQFSKLGQNYDGFSGTELVALSNGTNYLVVTPTEPPASLYRGCLVFEISDLATASLVRDAGTPVLFRRIEGTSGSFNGACGYVEGATASGVIYSEYNDEAPNFRMFASKATLN